MKTRLLRASLVCFACLSTVACLRSLDSSKIPCTTSDHCPSHYTCLNGFCSRGGADSGIPSDAVAMADGPRAETGDTGLVPEADVAPSTTIPDASLPETGGPADASAGGTSGGGGVDGGGGPARDAPGPDGATGGKPTGGAVATGGTTTGGTSGPGGALSLGGNATTGGAGMGGTSATGGVSTSSSKAGSSGAAGTSGGTTATGGTSSTGPGGASAGSTAGAGGTSSSSASTCQPKPRDCTSTLDNNCNGTPDNQETSSCACPAGQKRACQEHPGYDGTGLCKAGSQTCAASTDKTTSSWGDCTGAVGPVTEVCDAAGVDENCNGQPNEGCECVNGASIPCDCGPATTCTNGKKGTCSVTKVTLYLDSDGDGHGNPAQPGLVCPGTSRYVTNHDDCDDTPSGASFYPGISICSTVMERKWCPTTGGILKTEPCDDGCINGICRNDGTIGVPGYVSCTTTHSPRCTTAQGCNLYDGTCGATGGTYMQCDGPGDCKTGESCCVQTFRSGAQTVCTPGACTASSSEVCDPLANTCTCTSKDFAGYIFNTCP